LVGHRGGTLGPVDREVAVARASEGTQAAEPVALALDAGLEYVNDTLPGLTRKRGREGWVYYRQDGTPITDPAERARIDAIRIPPRWTHVWISPSPRGHIQATGRDSRSRKQYRYHERWREVRDATKFGRMAAFGEALPGLRLRIDADLDLQGLARDKVLAAVVRLMDETLIRIGNEQYARENRSFGLTTLRHEHVRIEDPATVQFEFRAKSGKEQRVRLSDPRLASVVHACHELPGQELFSYIDDDGRIADVGSEEVNAYLRTVTGGQFSAKDFRTWGGSVTVAEVLVGLGPPRSATDAKRKIIAALDAAAARLNNTRAVCRASYVNPRVPDSYVDGSLADAFERAQERERLRHAECAMLVVVAESP
jgi:DNA topoisomerase-1